MPRGRRRNQLQSIVEPLAARFAADLAGAMQSHVMGQVREQVESFLSQLGGAKAAAAAAPTRGRRRGAGTRRGAKLPRACRVPGCKNPNKGPRYDFFCEEHRELTAPQKAAIKGGLSLAEALAGKKPPRGKK